MSSAGTPSNSVLASIFVLSMLVIGLVPYTLHRIFSGSAPKQAVKRSRDVHSAWGRAAAAQAGKRSGGALAWAKTLLAPGNIALVLLWLLAAALMLHIRSAAEEVRPFDPFEILGVSTGATDKEIKRAYRQLSLKFHPDKNPDPAAATYFAEFISPAYKALTDETARANLEKHGHPDGPQGMSVGVALPAFLFEKGRAAPLVLAAIVGVGILLPLAVVVCYITRQSEYTSNNILQRTLYVFFHLTEQKNSLSDPKFQKLHPAAKKALILLHAQLARQGASVPDALQTDFLHVMDLAPKLLEELVKLTLRPRAPMGYFWLRPALSVLEFSQCLTQALPVGSRQEKAGALADASQSLLQLPHADANVVKKLTRAKIKSLHHLMSMDSAARAAAVGLTKEQLSDFDAFISGVPCVTLRASCETEGEEGGEILEGDLATCTVNVSLERLGAAEAVPTPFFPGSKEEGWWLLLADVSSNALLAAQKVHPQSKIGLKSFLSSVQASASQSAVSSARSAAEPTSADGASKDADVNSSIARSSAQPSASGPGTKAPDAAEGDTVVQLKFRAPPAGLHLLQVMCVSDYWVGCDRKIELRLKVGKMARADRKLLNAGGEDAKDEIADDDSDAGGNGSASGEDDAADDDDDLTESGTSVSSQSDED